ncbi:polymorphic toxin-type HINT domain-containing protein [Streptomyces chryseus]|uniref:polymorphic toxin-type HINT domain-containing protein n=1 Tax=Streptomyces chryseus TaxID=68186 RepID=UPI00110FF834|nr:polymorphic toxin-type HINT domain-containing protein [Streptomyces chryseus]
MAPHFGRPRRRRRQPRTEARLLGLRKAQSGQTTLEYAALVLVVAAIVGALVATGLGQTIAQQVGAAVCRVTGAGDCEGGDPQAGDRDGQGSGDGDTDGAGDSDGDNATDADADADADGDATKSPEQIAYEKALNELQDAKNAEQSDAEKAEQAAKELGKILAEELGITDAVDCVTKGDAGACTDTLINVLTSLIGGAVGKLAAKYGAPWKWKKAAELIRKLKKHGDDLYDGLTGMVKNRKRVKEAQDKLADAQRKLDEKKPDQAKPDKPKPDQPDKKPITCAGAHSFLPGTPVLLADGSRAPIETVRVGDRVTVTDPVSGVTTSRRVTHTITTYDDKHFTRLTVRTPAGLRSVTATDTHPFWLTGAGAHRWADAGDIRPGASLRASDGSALPVTAVAHHTRRQTTHDLTVAGIHTYYVGVGSRNALVHNNDCVDKELLDEMKETGVKFDPEKVIRAERNADGKIVFLEEGNSRAGLKHILEEHADDFERSGIAREDIPDLVMQAATKGKKVGTQGKGDGRPIYEVEFKGQKRRVAVTVGNNGFVVGANPKSAG